MKSKITKLFILVLFIVVFSSLSVAHSQKPASVIFMPIMLKNTDPSQQNGSHPDILTYTHEYEEISRYSLMIESRNVQIAGTVFKWNNQNWNQYVLWYRKQGTTSPWCYMSRDSQTRSIWYGARLGPDFCYDNQVGGPLTEFVLADGLSGQESNQSAPIFVDLITVDDGTANISPPFVLSVEVYPIEGSGDVLIRWTHGRAAQYYVRYFVNGGPAVTEPVGHWHSRSKLLTGFSPGDQVTITALAESNPSNTVVVQVQ